jgi:hypothetical protein
LLRQGKGRRRKFAARRRQDVPAFRSSPQKEPSKVKARLALIGALVLAIGGPALAQPAAPLKMSMDYDGALYPLNLVPVKVLVIHADGDSRPGGFAADVSMKSYGILRALKRVDIDAEAQGRIGEDGQAYPSVFSYIHHDGKRVRHVHVSWTPGDVQATSTPPFFDLGQPPATRAQKLAATDPLTQFVRVAVASGPQAICRGPDRFFDGKQLYALDFGRAEPANLTSEDKAMGLVHGAQCTVRFSEVAGFKAKPPKERDQGLRGPITMVFAQAGADGPWVLANLHADTVIGYANIVLKKLSVSGQRPKA